MNVQISHPSEVGMSAKQLDLIRERGAEWCDSHHSSLVLLVARRGKIVLHEAFGRQLPTPDSPPAAVDHLYPLSSISKPITATAIMKMVDLGLVGLNRPVTEYIPEFQGKGKELVTVHHLLNHTSGIGDNLISKHLLMKLGSSDRFAAIPAAELRRRHLELGYDAPLLSQPGERHYYSIYGYELLGEILARVAQQPMGDFIYENLFLPLGMHDSWFIVPDQQLGRLVKRPDSAPFATPQSPTYAWLPEMYQAILHMENGKWPKTGFAGGSACSTSYNIFRFAQMLLNRGQLDGVRVLSPASVATMTRMQAAGIDQWMGDDHLGMEATYGYGWDIPGESHYLFSSSLESASTFRHSGGGGVSLTVDPENELIAIYFSTILQLDHLNMAVSNNDLFVNMAVAAILD